MSYIKPTWLSHIHSRVNFSLILNKTIIYLVKYQARNTGLATAIIQINSISSRSTGLPSVLLWCALLQLLHHFLPGRQADKKIEEPLTGKEKFFLQINGHVSQNTQIHHCFFVSPRIFVIPVFLDLPRPGWSCIMNFLLVISSSTKYR